MTLKLIKKLKSLGVILFVEDGQLSARDPNEAITPGLFEDIKSLLL